MSSKLVPRVPYVMIRAIVVQDMFSCVWYRSLLGGLRAAKAYVIECDLQRNIYRKPIPIRLICATVCFAVIGVHVRRVVSSAVVRSRIIIHVTSVSIVVSASTAGTLILRSTFGMRITNWDTPTSLSLHQIVQLTTHSSH